uniref:Uncharacterized protein n=1 Tax=Steinernema glaseri TaxID=37863 RepID=A0A1I7YKM8_9BILA
MILRVIESNDDDEALKSKTSETCFDSPGPLDRKAVTPVRRTTAPTHDHWNARVTCFSGFEGLHTFRIYI